MSDFSAGVGVKNPTLFSSQKINTFLKCSSPSLIRGVVLNWRCEDMINEPDFNSYKFDMTNIKSDVFLTGRKRERGTLMPIAF